MTGWISRGRRRLWAALAAVGLVTLAVSVKFVILPSLLQLPEDLNLSIQLIGTASLVDAKALQAGNLQQVIRSKVPITITNSVKVVSIEGQTAVIANRATVTGPNEQILSDNVHSWAINRRTFQPAPVPPGSDAQPHQGLVAGFPLDIRPRDYPFWDFATQSVAPAKYLGTETMGGREAYKFNVYASGPVKDPGLLRMRPAGIPLNLTATTDATYWVDAHTATVLQVNQKQDTRAALALGGVTVPIGSVFSLDAHFTPEAADRVRQNAAKQQRGVSLLRTTIPAALGLLATGLVALAAWPTLYTRWRYWRY
jgi:hypothetical protein